MNHVFRITAAVLLAATAAWGTHSVGFAQSGCHPSAHPGFRCAACCCPSKPGHAGHGHHDYGLFGAHGAPPSQAVIVQTVPAALMPSSFLAPSALVVPGAAGLQPAVQHAEAAQQKALMDILTRAIQAEAAKAKTQELPDAAAAAAVPEKKDPLHCEEFHHRLEQIDNTLDELGQRMSTILRYQTDIIEQLKQDQDRLRKELQPRTHEH